MASSKHDTYAVRIFVGLALLVAAVLGFVAYKKLTALEIGPDNCVYEDSKHLRRKAVDQLVIVVDESEALSPSHKRQVQELIVDYVADEARLKERAAVSLYGFGKNDFLANGAGQDLRALASLCRPPATGNVVYEGKKKLEKVFHQRFIVPVFLVLDEALGGSLGERSPILEMLQYISRTQDIKDGAGNAQSKTLILVSDLLQHSTNFSHYKAWSYDEFQRSAWPLLKTDLRGWKVQILYLQRYGKDQQLQNAQLEDFWMRYFHDAGAKIEIIQRIP